MLSQHQQALHDRALELCQKRTQVESEIIAVLQQIEESKLFKRLGFSSLFQYAVQALGLTEAVAYGFITVARRG